MTRSYQNSHKNSPAQQKKIKTTSSSQKILEQSESFQKAYLQVVGQERTGQRLDNYLVYLLKGVPKSHIYRLIRQGQVRVNKKRAKQDQKLLEGDQIRIPPMHLAAKQEIPRVSEQSLNTLHDHIIYEDKYLIALNKPSGFASHGGSGIRLGVIEALRQREGLSTLELVHRLDRDTSGVLLLAKKRSMLTLLQAAIRDGNTKKRYLTLVMGKLPKSVIHIDAPLRKFVLQGGERMVRVDPLGKPSISHFRELETYQDCSLVEVLLETGRTHQIRVHAQHIGCPILGDEKYGDAAINKKMRDTGLKRLFLHAAEFTVLKTEHPTPLSFSATLPDELCTVLKRLEK